jgi:hypothetical protein
VDSLPVDYLSHGLATIPGLLCACESYMAGNCEHTRVRNECVRSHDSDEGPVSVQTKRYPDSRPDGLWWCTLLISLSEFPRAMT